MFRDLARRFPDVTFLASEMGAQETTLRDPPPNYFRFAPTGAQTTAGLGTYAYRDLGWRRAVIAAEDWYPGLGGRGGLRRGVLRARRERGRTRLVRALRSRRDDGCAPARCESRRRARDRHVGIPDSVPDGVRRSGGAGPRAAAPERRCLPRPEGAAAAGRRPVGRGDRRRSLARSGSHVMRRVSRGVRPGVPGAAARGRRGDGRAARLRRRRRAGRGTRRDRRRARSRTGRAATDARRRSSSTRRRGQSGSTGTGRRPRRTTSSRSSRRQPGPRHGRGSIRRIDGVEQTYDGIFGPTTPSPSKTDPTCERRPAPPWAT